MSILLAALLPAMLLAQASSVIITGKTNVNTFKCYNPNIDSKIAEALPDHSKKQRLALLVQDFDCRNRVMTADFRKTLSADRYPKLFLSFLKFEKIQKDLYRASVEVTLTEKHRIYEVEFRKVKNSFIGTKTVRFSDFGLVPPKKMRGMVVVDDALELNINLVE